MSDEPESLHFLDYWRVICTRKEIVIAVSLLVVLTGIGITFTLPKVYMSSTVIAVREEKPDVQVFANEPARYDPLFLRTQFEVIQSRPVLDQVIRDLGLIEVFGEAWGITEHPNRADLAYRILSNRMRVQQYRDTNLIEIQIHLSEPRDEAPQWAARIANAVVVSFRDRRSRASREEIDRALQAVQDSLQEQRQHVRELEEQVEAIRREYEIDMVGSSGGPVSSLSKLSLQQIEAQRLRARMEVAEKKARLENINRLGMTDLLAAAPYVVEDLALMRLVADKRNAEVELSHMRESYGDNHPQVVSLFASIAELEAKIQDALEGLILGVRTDYEAAAAKLAILEEEAGLLRAQERVAEGEGYRLFERARTELQHAIRIRDVLEMRYLQERIEMRIPRTTVEVVEAAQPPSLDAPVSPNLYLNVVLSVLLGLGAGLGLAFFVEYLDTSVKTIDELERYISAPVLGVVPQKVRPLSDSSARPADAEAYRVLRTNLQFSRKMSGERMLCCTSGSMGEGKSLTIYNLGCACAQLGEKVLIVDADLHRPTQHKMANVSNEVGLANVLVGDVSLADAIVETPMEQLYLLPSGRLQAGTHGLLGSMRMKNMMHEMRTAYDWVLFDAPPIIGVSDACVLAREVDGVLLVIQHRKYPRAVSIRAKNMLTTTGGNLVGVVLNNINISRDYSYYYYHYTGQGAQS